MLLLVLVPTTGRVVHASAAGAVAGAEGMRGHAPGHAAHAADPRHAHRGGADGSGGSDRRAAIGDPDCDYCPLLASMLTAPGVFLPAPPLRGASAPAIAPKAPRLRWLHPFGLGSRGPPLHG